MVDLRLRPRRPADDAFVRRLAESAFGEYSTRAAEHTAAMSAGARTIVATLEGRRVGFAVIERPRPGVAHLAAIAVSEDERGRGVGRALLEAAEGDAKRRRARVLGLTTADANVSALDLFLRRGFRVVRRLSRYYARGQDAVVLEKEL